MDDVKKLKYQSLAAFAALVLIIAGAVFGILRYNRGGFSRSELLKYEEFYSQVEATEQNKKLLPWRKGKVLLMQPTAENPSGSGPLIHDQHWELPENLQAKPGDVDTVIIVIIQKIHIGNYTNGAKAYREDARLTILDPDTGELMGKKLVPGSNPPNAILKTQFMSASGNTNLKSAVEALPLQKRFKK